MTRPATDAPPKRRFVSIVVSRHDHAGGMNYTATDCSCTCGQRWRLHDRLGWVPRPYRGHEPSRTVTVHWPTDWETP